MDGRALINNQKANGVNGLNAKKQIQAIMTVQYGNILIKLMKMNSQCMLLFITHLRLTWTLRDLLFLLAFGMFQNLKTVGNGSKQMQLFNALMTILRTQLILITASWMLMWQHYQMKSRYLNWPLIGINQSMPILLLIWTEYI